MGPFAIQSLGVAGTPRNSGRGAARDDPILIGLDPPIRSPRTPKSTGPAESSAPSGADKDTDKRTSVHGSGVRALRSWRDLSKNAETVPSATASPRTSQCPGVSKWVADDKVVCRWDNWCGEPRAAGGVRSPSAAGRDGGKTDVRYCQPGPVGCYE